MVASISCAELQSPSDDAIATMGTRQTSEGQGGVTDATAERAMEPDNYEDIAKHKIIQVGGTVLNPVAVEIKTLEIINIIKL